MHIVPLSTVCTGGPEPQVMSVCPPPESTTAKVNFLTQPQIWLGLVTILKESTSWIDQCCLWVGSFVRADEAVLRNLSQPEPLLSVHERRTEILPSTSAVSCRLAETDMCANTRFGSGVSVRHRDEMNSASHSCFKLTVTFKTLCETRCLH